LFEQHGDPSWTCSMEMDSSVDMDMRHGKWTSILDM
jgi:hypothetical protein